MTTLEIEALLLVPLVTDRLCVCLFIREFECFFCEYLLPDTVEIVLKSVSNGFLTLLICDGLYLPRRVESYMWIELSSSANVRC